MKTVIGWIAGIVGINLLLLAGCTGAVPTAAPTPTRSPTAAADLAATVTPEPATSLATGPAPVPALTVAPNPTAALPRGSATPPASETEVVMFRGDVQHTGVYEAEGVPELDGVKWKFESMGSDQYSLTGASRNIPVIAGEVRASPAIGGGGVYFGSDDGHLYALE